MCYYVKIVKPSDKRTDDTEIRGTGEFEIRELFNETLMLKTDISEEYANEVVYQLNAFLSPKFKNGDIVQLAMLIRNYLKEWIGSNLINGKMGNTSGRYEDAVNYVVGRIMKDNSKYLKENIDASGYIDPLILEKIIRLEKTAWENTNINIG